GNGPWDGRTHWGDAVLELDSSATQLLGNYTPVNTAELEASDADLGSTSPVLLGGNLIAQGGKDGSIKLLDWRQKKGTAPHRDRARAREARVRWRPLEQPYRGGRQDRAAGRELERSRDERDHQYLAAPVRRRGRARNARWRGKAPVS